MIGFIVKKIIGSKNDREVKKLRPLVAQINEIEAGLQKLSDDDLRQKTAAWKEELSKIEDNDGTGAASERDPARSVRRGEERLPPAVRHRISSCADIRIKWEMIPFDVQLIGGYGLAQRARLRKWPPAKARRSSPRCRFISTRSPGAACMS